jgi:hypothetical protein
MVAEYARIANVINICIDGFFCRSYCTFKNMCRDTELAPVDHVAFCVNFITAADAVESGGLKNYDDN